MVTCAACGGKAWTADGSKTHYDRLHQTFVMHQLRMGGLDAIPIHWRPPTAEAPFPCLACNKTEMFPIPTSEWTPYYPRWERDADGDRTSSVEWRSDPRCRHLILNGLAVVFEDGRLTRRRKR